MARKKNPKKKLEIVFDPQKRREFLTGFSKRKNERRKRAKEDLERRLKEERKRIRQDIKEGIKHLKKTFEPLRELTEEDKASEEITIEEEIDDGDVKIKIVELTTREMAKQKHFLGDNCSTEEEEEEEEESDEKISKQIANNINCIPGMDFDFKSSRKSRAEEDSDNDSTTAAIATTTSNRATSKVNFNQNQLNIKNKKDINHLTKTKTLKQLRKSKVFQMKERFDRKVNQKKARREKNNTLRSLPKHLRKQKKFATSRYRKGRLVNKKQLRCRKGEDK